MDKSFLKFRQLNYNFGKLRPNGQNKIIQICFIKDNEIAIPLRIRQSGRSKLQIYHQRFTIFAVEISYIFRIKLAIFLF